MYKQITRLLILSMILSLLSVEPVLAQSGWDGWAISAGNGTLTDGTYTISSVSSGASSLSKKGNVAESYEFITEFSVEKFGTEQGFQISTGKSRIQIYFNPGKIMVWNGNGASEYAGNVGGGMHELYLSVEGKNVLMELDGETLGKFTARDNSSMSPQMTFWTKGPSESMLKIYSAKYITEDESREEIEEIPAVCVESDWQSGDKLGWSLPEGAEIKDGALVMYNDAWPIRSATYPVGNPGECTIEFRLKTDMSSANNSYENGMRLEWNGRRVFLMFYEDCMKYQTDKGNMQVNMDFGKEWHTYRVEVNGEYADIYIDGRSAVNNYKLAAYNSNTTQLAFHVRAGGSEPVQISVDWIRYTPHIYTMDVVSVADGSCYSEGSSVKLRTVNNGENTPETVEYYINDILIGSAGKENSYELLWTAEREGSYILKAKSGEEQSKQKRISVVSGCYAQVQMPEAASVGADVTANVTLREANGKSIKSVQWYYDGSTVFKGGVNCVIKAVQPGIHNVYAKVNFNDGSNYITKPQKLTVRGELSHIMPPQYEIVFQHRQGTEGRLVVRDSYYGLSLTFKNAMLMYGTADGEKSIAEESGEYRVRVNMGTAALLCNGKQVLSFIMQTDNYEENRVEGDAFDGIETVFSDKLIYNYQAGERNEYGISKSELPLDKSRYEFGFIVSGSKNAEIMISDTQYRLNMTLKDGKISVDGTLDGLVTGEEQIGELPDKERAFVYGNVSGGILTLYADKEFIGGARLPKCFESGMIWTKTADDALESFCIADYEEKFTYKEDFSGANSDFANYIQPEKASVSVNTSEKCANIIGSDKTSMVRLNVSGGDYSIKAKMRIDYCGGDFGFILRGNGFGTGTRVVYSEQTGQFRIIENTGSDRLAAAVDFELPIGKDIEFEAAANGTLVTLYVNGEKLVSGSVVANHGFAGIIAGLTGIKLMSVEYSGDSAVTPGKVSNILNCGSSADGYLTEDGGIFLSPYGETGYVSYDNGKSWTLVDCDPRISDNAIKLSNGEVLGIQKMVYSDGTQIDNVWISADDGKTIQGPYPIEPEAMPRATMPNKVVQARDGRIYVCVGEVASGSEDSGCVRVYFSDDNGRTWARGEKQLRTEEMETKINLQECKIVEMPDGKIRLYVRDDWGFLYYTESEDRGYSFSERFVRTQFASVLCAFNIERDPYEESTYYMFWEYDNKNESAKIQNPRTRAALAVSFDGCETWQYVCDITETDYNYDYAVNSHMNHALRVYKDCIITNVCDKNTEGKWKMNVTAIDKKLLSPLARFEALRFRGETHEPSEMVKNYISDTMIISPVKGRASVAGREYEFEPADCGYIPINIAAMYIGGSIKEKDDSISVAFGEKVCEMRINEKKYTVNGDVKEAELPVIDRNGTVYVPMEILQRAFDKKIHTLTDGVFVINAEEELNSDIWRTDRY